MEEKKNQIVDAASQLLRLKEQRQYPPVTGISLLCGDGSQRMFYRLTLEDNSTIVAVLVNEDNPLNHLEAVSAWHISRHLFAAGVPVPDPLAFDNEMGLILFEDLGDTRLYDLLKQEDCHEDCRIEVYREVIRELVKMQVKGREGFDTGWCWQTSHFNRELMLERESGYFLQALCHDFFNMTPDVSVLNQEFVRIAETAAKAPADFFLHRDFQSRNIMIKDDAVRIIDFQGGRLGPLGYDLASLLIDPYVCLPADLQETLFDEYLSELMKTVEYDPQAFREEYLYLALQRNMQILGAFAFLGKQRGKKFFLDFINPALVSMLSLLKKVGTGYPALTSLIETCLGKIDVREF